MILGLLYLVPSLLLLELTNALNLAPIFTADMNHHTVTENTPIGTLIYTLKGQDPEGSKVTFGLEGTDKFRVNSETGEIFVTQIIDREERSNNEIRLTVIIQDEVKDSRPNIVRVPISLIILDVNDNEPIFRGLPYTTIINEDTPLDTIIFQALEVTDADLIGDVLDVKCVGVPSLCDYFEIQPRREETDHDMYRGTVLLKKSLNYKDNQILRVPISVFDGLHTVSSEMIFEVQDVQNSPPVFSGVLTGVVNEDDSIGTKVLSVTAKDGDSGNPRKIIYDLVSNPFDYFIIDSNSGTITIDKNLDREISGGVLTLTVRASEFIQGGIFESSEEISSYANVTLTIRDVNDEPPTFNQKEYSVSIPENVPYGTPFANLNMEIKDLDTGPNSLFKIELIDPTGKFDVEPKKANGHIAVSLKVNSKKLDFENPNERKFLLRVVATETNTKEKLSSTATVIVTVEDLNDNSPAFDKDTFTAIIEESDLPGTEVITIRARDQDGDDFGTKGLRYSLSGSGSELFDINEVTGKITIASCTQNCIDYERIKAYFLSYTATDSLGSGRRTVVNLRISISDSNDNPPFFNKKDYSATIDETKTEFQPHLMLRASDVDDTSELTFHIRDGNINDLFHLNSETGEITVTDKNGLRLDNIPTDRIRLKAEVSDGKFTDTCTVIIVVKDVNDRSPIFEKETYEVSIPENIKYDTVVEEVKAVDADFGDNSVIHYMIQKGAYDDFVINNTTGEIKVSGNLDYDTKERYSLEVIAADNGFPSLTGTATVLINVLNKNDKIPYFTPTTQRIQITEDTEVGTNIYQLNATDPDVKTGLEYFIVSPISAVDKDGKQLEKIEQNYFSINSSTGEVYVADKLNRNLASIITMTVKAIDTSADFPQEGIGYLIVTVMDVNDFEPRFSEPWSLEQPYITIDVNEEESNGSIVYSFSATDQDSNIDYFLIKPKSMYFKVDKETGDLIVKQRLDYEVMEDKRITFDLYVYDAGVPQKSAHAFVVVNIINLNDETPIFNQTYYNASVKEHSPVNSEILRVFAKDDDYGEFGNVLYSLEGSHKQYFSIHPDTGVISITNASLLDRESIEHVYLTAVASDLAPSDIQRSSSVLVNITIEDVNDNAPTFLSKSYEAVIVDNIPVHPNPSPIVQLTAVDLDKGINSQLYFYIVSGNEENMFFINHDSGVIYPNASFSGHNGEKFELKVNVVNKVSDVEWPNPSAANVKITIEKVNSHKPQWFPPPPPNETKEILEESESSNVVIHKVNAIDLDVGENQRISYFLKINNVNVGETNEFSIDEMTGELRAKVSFDREVKDKYELVLVARDHGTPVNFETLRFLTIIIKDINDYVPVFKVSQPVRFTVPENENPGYHVGQVSAFDPDVDSNGKIYYYIINGNSRREFSIDKTYGNLYTKSKLDRETIPEYNLIIKASNKADFVCDGDDCDIEYNSDEEKNNTNLIVQILVEDLNDNFPMFEEKEFFVGLSLHAKVGDLVLDAKAIDPDSTIETQESLVYSIRSSNLYKRGSQVSSGSLIPSPFELTSCGRILLSSLMTEFNQDKFVLDIEVRELSTPEHKSNAIVHLWIYEPKQLIKLIINKSPLEVNKQKRYIIQELNNVTQKTVVLDDLRYHVSEEGLMRDQTDMYLHTVDIVTNTIISPEEIIRTVDANYDHLNRYYEKAGIQSIVLSEASISKEKKGFDLNIAALIACLLILFLGIILFSLLCCCLETWAFTKKTSNKPVRLQESPNPGPYKPPVPSSINEVERDTSTHNGTDNPLWIDQKYKAYEEQELTMTVFTDQENSVISGNNQHSRSGSLLETQSNAYATINKLPHASNSARRRSNLFGGYLAHDSDGIERDYVTLDKNLSRSPLGPTVPGIHSTPVTYQGSLPRRFNHDSSTDLYRNNQNNEHIVINKHGEPEMLADLL